MKRKDEEMSSGSRIREIMCQELGKWRYGFQDWELARGLVMAKRNAKWEKGVADNFT